MQQEDVKKCLTDAQKLHQWLQAVPYGEYNKVKSRLVEACLVNITTFNNWVYGRCRIPMAAKRDMNSVAVELTGKEIFTIFDIKKFSKYST